MEEKSKKTVFSVILIAAAALACAAVFAYFGRRSAIPETDAASPPPSITGAPSGVTAERFVSALEEGVSRSFSGPVRSGGALEYTFEMPTQNDGAALTVRTDEIGRVESCVLEIGYLYIPENSFGGAVGEKLKEEYARRTGVDLVLIREYLSAVFGSFGGECGIGPAERTAIAKAVSEKYLNGGELSKKYGGARLICATGIDGENGRFTLEIRFKWD